MKISIDDNGDEGSYITFEWTDRYNVKHEDTIRAYFLPDALNKTELRIDASNVAQKEETK